MILYIVMSIINIVFMLTEKILLLKQKFFIKKKVQNENIETS